MAQAGAMAINKAVVQKSLSIATGDGYKDRFAKFCRFAKENGINRLEHVSAETFAAYGRELTALIADGEITASYAQNLVSSANSVMGIITKGHWKSVSPTKDCKIPKRSNVRETSPASLNGKTGINAITAAYQQSQNAGHVAELAHELGLRMKESALLDASRAAKEARSHGCVTVDRGTKGGQSRVVSLNSNPEIRAQQTRALEIAALTQGNAKSMIPPDLSYAQFLNGDLRDTREAIKECGLTGYHDFRAGYACNRYQQETGWAAPCTGGAILDREKDYAARASIAEELGHHRIDVIATYIGGR
ncbi:MAG: integrase domain-containing protein [Oceanococcus sp.]